MKNGVPFPLSNGSDTVNRAFDGLLPTELKIDGFSAVTTLSTCGGFPFTSTLSSIHTLVDGAAVVLLGASVTTSDGYTGTVTPAQCAGPGRIIT